MVSLYAVACNPWKADVFVDRTLVEGGEGGRGGDDYNHGRQKYYLEA